MTTQDPVQAERQLAGRYVLIEEIGRGGMGIVWLAEDRMIGRRVAIKELHLPAGVEPAERTVFEERVLREARAAGRLNDPGVVTVYDVLQEAGATYIVMELIQATTLSDIVRQRGPLPVDQVARLAEQLLSALEVAHASGVVHRDVKPSNIMVLPNGRVKLTDFGIAQSTDDPRLTTSGILVGSPSYMAPERIRGAEADSGSDLWALAAVLYFAVEGQPAFERSSSAATMHAIINEVPYLTRCQGPLASVIMGLLNATPAARPSAEQVRGLLAQATFTPPVGLTMQTAPVGGTMRYQPNPNQATAAYGPARRNKGGRALAITLVVVLAAALLTGGFFLRQALLPGAATPANMDSTLTYGTGGDIVELSWQSYPAGNCLNGEFTPGHRITESAYVECKEPHDIQGFERRTMFAKPADYDDFVDVGYPNRDGMKRYAEQLCTLAFESERILGSDEEKAKLRYRALIPAEFAWRNNRDVVCMLYAEKGQLTKSWIKQPPE